MSLKKSIVFFILSFAIIFGVITNCKKKSTSVSSGAVSSSTISSATTSNQTHFVIQMHDAPFMKSGKNVTALNITVEKIEIIRSSDKAIITLSDTPQAMGILSIAANNPVVLSDVSVEPGLYDQIRLVLSRDYHYSRWPDSANRHSQWKPNRSQIKWSLRVANRHPLYTRP